MAKIILIGILLLLIPLAYAGADGYKFNFSDNTQSFMTYNKLWGDWRIEGLLNTAAVNVSTSLTVDDVNVCLQDGTNCEAHTVDTTYTASGTLLDLSGTVFSVNEGTLTNTKWCKYTAGTGLDCNVEPVTNTDTHVQADDYSLYNDSTTMYLNTTTLNETVMVLLNESNLWNEINGKLKPSDESRVVNATNALHVYGQDDGITLQVHTPSESYWSQCIYNDAYSLTDFIFCYYMYNNGNAAMGNEENKNLSFYTNGFSNERMTIENNGAMNLRGNLLKNTKEIINNGDYIGNYFNGTGANFSYTKTASDANFVNRSKWITHDNYPPACSGTQGVRGIGDSLTCFAVPVVQQTSTMHGGRRTGLSANSYLTFEGTTFSATIGYPIFPQAGSYEDFACRADVTIAQEKSTVVCEFREAGVVKCSCNLDTNAVAIAECTSTCGGEVTDTAGSFYISGFDLPVQTIGSIFAKVEHVHT